MNDRADDAKGRAGASWLWGALLVLMPSCALADMPATILYQGTLKQSGAPVNGAVPMVLRLTSADGSAQYWTSGSTTVAVDNGRFRYPLGTPNEAAFKSIDWSKVPSVELTVSGTLLLPRETLNAVPYALVAGGLSAGAVIQAPVLDLAGNRVTSLGAPVLATDAVNKAYVDAAAVASNRVNGTLVVQSTSTTADVPMIRAMDNAGKELLRVQQDGKVGIGTTNPIALLQVGPGASLGYGIASRTLRISGAGQTDLLIQDTSDSSVGGMYADSTGINVRAASNHPLILLTNNSEKMRIASGGNVGIGNSNPIDKLEISSGNITIHGAAGTRVNFDSTATAGGRRWGLLAGDSVSGYGHGNAFGLHDFTAGQFRWVVDQNGNVGIGTVSPAAKLEVQGGPIKASGGLILQTFSATDTTTPRPTAPGSLWIEQ